MVNLSKYKALTDLIRANSDFQIRNDKVFCQICTKGFKYLPKEGVAPLTKHLRSFTHISAKKINDGKKQSELVFSHEKSNKYSEFDKDLVEAFCAANIPFKKIGNPKMKFFLEKYCKIFVKSESFYRKFILDDIYKSKITDLYLKYRNIPIYLIFDEATTITGRSILNILIGQCGEYLLSPKLISVVDIDKTNAEVINQRIIGTLTQLYGGNINYSLLRLLVSDAAPYAVKAGKMLKLLFPKLKHVTCLCHMLHRLCETIRQNCTKLDSFMADFKRIFIKNKNNQEEFIKNTQIKLPKFPVLTRWGTWIECASYIFKNYAILLNFFNSNPTIYCQLSIVFENETLINQLRFVNNCQFITEAINKLENEAIRTEEQVKILLKVISKVHEDNDVVLVKKMSALIKKNPDLNFFLTYNAVTCGIEEKLFEYVPLVSASAERSFSLLKILFTERRTNLTPDNLEKLLILYYNK
jgi:hypothetical protein